MKKERVCKVSIKGRLNKWRMEKWKMENGK